MLVEAMIFEKPVVCADIGGISEIVNDGTRGCSSHPTTPRLWLLHSSG